MSTNNSNGDSNGRPKEIFIVIVLIMVVVLGISALIADLLTTSPNQKTAVAEVHEDNDNNEDTESIAERQKEN